MQAINDRNAKYPDEHLIASRRDISLQGGHNWEENKDILLVSADDCESCGCKAAELSWFYFRSPEWTWKYSCGSEGWVGMCDRCNLQINYFEISASDSI